MNAHHYQGLSLLRQGRHTEALAALRKARADNPHSLQIASDLAIALLRNDRGQEATAVAEGIVALSPNSPLGHATLGMIHLGRGQTAAGEAAFRRAIALDPEDADTHGLLARAHLEGGRPEAALAATDSGLALDAENDLCLTFRARALLALGRFAESEIVSARLLQLDPEDSYSHGIRGEELLLAGHPDQAAVHFREALRLDPHNESARYHHAVCLKARSPFFALALRCILSLAKLKVATLIALMVGLIFGFQAAEKWLHDQPVWLPVLVAVKLLVWAALIVATLANPLYDLLLSADRHGRLALSRDELRATRWYLACFAAAGLCFWWSLNMDNPSRPRLMALSFVFLVRLVAEVFEATPGYVRKRMAWLTISMATVIALSPLLIIIPIVVLIRSDLVGLIPAATRILLLLALVPMLVSGFGDDIRAWLERRRPDSD